MIWADTPKSATETKADSEGNNKEASEQQRRREVRGDKVMMEEKAPALPLHAAFFGLVKQNVMCKIPAAPLTQFNVAVVSQEDVGSLWENKHSVHQHPGTRSTAASWHFAEQSSRLKRF